MRKSFRLLLTTMLAGGAFGAIAQTLKPGLWEIDNRMSSSSGEMEKTMLQAQKELANMPAAQRKMMEEMMAKQGVGMGAGAGPGATSIKVCMTPEMVAHNDVVTQEGQCRHTRSPRVGNTMSFSFVCSKPPSRGEGQVTFVSPQAYTMKMSLDSAATGQTEKISLSASGKFLSSDCGSIKPISPPKK